MRISSEREFSLRTVKTGLREADAGLEPALLRELSASTQKAAGTISSTIKSKPGFVGVRIGSADEAALIEANPPADNSRQRRGANGAHPAADHAAGELASRTKDIVLGTALLVLLLPAMVLIYLALRLTEPGPALFAHRRVGRGGKEFSCFKFRTMCVDADLHLSRLLIEDEEALREWTTKQKLTSDPRVTRLGQFLRATSLDELPQLFNVLRGDMALVGPRPIVADELLRYGRFAADYCRVRPGLTGLWQVTRTVHTSYRRRVATDVYYVRNRSFGYDWRIMVATIPAVLLGNC